MSIAQIGSIGAKITNSNKLKGTVNSSNILSGKIAAPTSITKSIEPATKEKIGGIIVGDNLLITEGGILSVDVTAEAGPDNTKPITSAAVNTIVGDINALLSII